MFEITISSSKYKNKEISFIINKIRPKLKQIKAIMVREEFDGRENLAIATNEQNKDFLLSLIFDLVSEVIIRFYKENVLLDELRNKIQDKVMLHSFVKALTMFDKSSDKDFIKSKLTLSKTINIDSLYYFKLWDLTKRWKNIAVVISDNSSDLMLSGVFSDLIQFLISSNEIEFGDVYLSLKNKNVVAKSKDGTELFQFEYNNEENVKIKIVSELISLAPTKIVITKDFAELEVAKYLELLYDGRISILK